MKRSHPIDLIHLVYLRLWQNGYVVLGRNIVFAMLNNTSLLCASLYILTHSPSGIERVYLSGKCRDIISFLSANEYGVSPCSGCAVLVSALPNLSMEHPIRLKKCIVVTYIRSKKCSLTMFIRLEKCYFAIINQGNYFNKENRNIFGQLEEI